MLTIALLGLVAASVILTLLNWRVGLPLAILIGMLQDPIRKMTPGTPAILVLSSLPIWALIWMGALGGQDGWRRFSKAAPRVARASWLFGVSLLPGTVITFSYGLSAWPVAALGLFAYVAPILTLTAGYVFAKRLHDVERALVFYGIVSAVMLTGTLLEYGQVTPNWAAVGTDVLGGGWIRYPTTGGSFQLIAGFFRSPDIAAWHAATLVMVSLTLVFHRHAARRSLWMALVAWGGTCLIVTARRKGIVMPFVWASFMGLHFLRHQRATLLVRLALITLVTALAFRYASGEFGVTQDYFGYAQSTVADAPQRFVQGSFDSVWETFLEAGTFGSGIGTATQGGQHLGIQVAETWQESGPSKLMVEIGIPGIVGALALALALGRLAVGSVRRAQGSAAATLQLGVLAFIVANIACFTISHQIYSDLTILNVTAFLLGLGLSAPEWSPARNTVANNPVPARPMRVLRAVPSLPRASGVPE